jgi:Regulator of chromosome condensation (RCC1) repeat
MLAATYTRAMHQRGSGLAILTALCAVACIDLPEPLDERLPSDSTGSGGTAGAGVGGAGGSGGAVTGGGGGGPLPVCAPGQTRDCATIVELALGELHSCARASDGYVRCWGDNLLGQLGVPGLPSETNMGPVVLAELGPVDEIAAIRNATCARAGNAIQCWGRNTFGELALGNRIPQDGPQLAMVPAATRIEGRDRTFCAQTGDESLHCWGRPFYGQSEEESDFVSLPVAVVGLDGLGAIGRLSVGTFAGCVTSTDDSELRCWGGTDDIPLGDGDLGLHLEAIPIPLPAPVTVLGGSYNYCAVAGGDFLCWGSLGELGMGLALTPTPYVGVDGSAVAEVAGGFSHWCLRETAGVIRCMGFNIFGQFGPGHPQPSLIDPPIAIASQASALEVGWHHSCIVTQDGQAQCWGRNHVGQASAAIASDPLPPTTVTFDDG